MKEGEFNLVDFQVHARAVVRGRIRFLKEQLAREEERLAMLEYSRPPIDTEASAKEGKPILKDWQQIIEERE